MRVYRDCDGAPNRLCQGHSYDNAIGIGGAGTGSSFANNVKALASRKFNMRLVEAHHAPDTSTALFGHNVSMPIYGAPATGVHSFGGESVISETEYCRSTVFGCGDAGTIGWTVAVLTTWTYRKSQ